MQAIVKGTVMKSMESNGYSVQLITENEGEAYRVNVFDGSTPRSRVFASYAEASDYFDASVQGN